jgi:hypothetical protein
LKILRGKGVKYARNWRDSVEKTQNHLETPWPSQEMEWKRKKTYGSMGGGAHPPYIGWKPETRTCPASRICSGHRRDMSGKNYLGSSINFRNCPKMIFNGFWHSANRIYICVVHGQVLKSKYIYIYGLKPFES